MSVTTTIMNSEFSFNFLAEIEKQNNHLSKDIKKLQQNIQQTSGSIDSLFQGSKEIKRKINDLVCSLVTKEKGQYNDTALGLSFQKLSLSDLSQAAQVCKEWYKIASDLEIQEVVWNRFLAVTNPSLSKKYPAEKEKLLKVAAGKQAFHLDRIANKLKA